MKKIILSRILPGAFILLILVQFIRPARPNATGSASGPDDIAHVVTVPANVQQILDASCNDCHSNHTDYPWYSYIQPVGFWLDHHVDEGKRELNFSEFATYKHKRQLHKLDEVIEMMETHEMPLSSYTTIHQDARLTPEQEQLLIEWARAGKEALKDSTAL
jgi:hypothetical protein